MRKAASLNLMIVSNLEFARLGFIERNAFKSVDLHYDSERTVSRPRDPWPILLSMLQWDRPGKRARPVRRKPEGR